MQPQKSHESYWTSLAHAYASIGPPLRPSREDIEFLETTIAEWMKADREAPLRAILLGVTPQIAEMRWPKAARLLAVDQSHEMAHAIWPGDLPGKRAAVSGDWLTLPQKDSSCDVVIGDGSINCLRYPEGFRALAREISRVLREDGSFILRCFIRPAVLEPPEKLFDSIFHSGLPSFHHFKFRLLMAMQPSARQGVAMGEVYRFWAAQNVDRDLLMSKTRWEKSAVDMIDLYRDSRTILTFPTESELRAVLLEFFEVVSTSSRDEGCLTLVLKSRRGIAK